MARRMCVGRAVEVTQLQASSHRPAAYELKKQEILPYFSTWSPLSGPSKNVKEHVHRATEGSRATVSATSRDAFSQ
jgi:hypothetical protein